MDNQEFQDRVRACERRLYATAYLLLHVTADCEDAVQEAVLRAWQRLPGLQNPQFFETWLTRIVINECKSQLRRRSRRGETELSPRLAAPVSPEPELHAALGVTDPYDTVWKLMEPYEIDPLGGKLYKWLGLIGEKAEARAEEAAKNS